jgi:hypothetical protein
MHELVKEKGLMHYRLKKKVKLQKKLLTGFPRSQNFWIQTTNKHRHPYYIYFGFINKFDREKHDINLDLTKFNRGPYYNEIELT